MKHAIAAVVVLFLYTGSFAQERNSVPQTPPHEVTEIARKALEDWKTTAMREPGALNLVGNENLVDAAELTAPFVRYRLFPVDIEKYVKSETLDPVGFARHYAYVFPIMNDGVFLGALRVAKTVQNDGQPDPGAEYVLEGIDTATHEEDTKVLSVLNAVRTTTFGLLGTIRFRAPRADLYVILKSGEDRYFLPGKAVTPALTTLDKRTISLRASSLAGMVEVKEQLRASILQ